MARSAAKRPADPGRDPADRDEWSRTVALVLVAVVLVLGASAWRSWLVVPLVFAVVLSATLAPVADRIERLGLGRAVSSVACTLLVALALLVPAMLVTAQAGQVVGDSDRFIERLSALAAEASGPLRDNSLFRAVAEAGEQDEDQGRDQSGDRGREDRGDEDEPIDSAIPVLPPDDDGTPDPIELDRDGSPGVDEGEGEGEGEGPDADAGQAADDPASQEYWRDWIGRNAGTIGGWVARGVGGVIGLIGQAIVMLFLVLYILYARGTWAERIENASGALGLRLGRGRLDGMGRLIARWMASILGLATGYAILIALVSGAIGLPQWPLWGILTGLLVLVPYFGPLIAAVMLGAVSAIAGQGWGPPMILLGTFLVLQLVETYVLTPRLYGRSAHFDPLTVLLGVLLFGFLWGPLGLIAALPVLVLIRGFIEAIPGSEPVSEPIGDL